MRSISVVPAVDSFGGGGGLQRDVSRLYPDSFKFATRHAAAQRRGRFGSVAAAIGGLETGDGQGEMNAALESRAPFFKVMHFEAPENTRREKERLTKARHFFCISTHPNIPRSTSGE